MLHRLFIQNLILVEHTEVSFTHGFNVITGETGSGKSVLLTAIALLLGERADSDLVRLGGEKATVIGIFDIPSQHFHTKLIPLLEEYSLDDLLDNPTMTIKREIAQTGKSKAYINDHLVPVSFLKQIGESLVEFSGQHAHMIMKDESYPLAVIDSSIHGMENQLSRFSSLYKREKEIAHTIKKIESDLAQRDAELERLQSDMKEILSSKILEIDVDELFSRFTALSRLGEISDTVQSISTVIEGSSGKHPPLLSICLNLQNQLERSKQIDPSLEQALVHMKAVTAELSEAGFILKKRLSSLNVDEEEHYRMEQKLSLIEKVEKRFGKDKTEIQNRLNAIQARIDELLKKDIELEESLSERIAVKNELDSLASKLHDMRTTAAQSLEKSIGRELIDLNMASSIFEIEVTPSPRSETGDSEVIFYLTPNKGEKKIAIATGASGGEMARIYLALQTVTSTLQKIPTIIFDEVDANIGGVTAIHVGKKLAAIGHSRQVIAITHFAQVTDSALNHLSIQKREENGRTYTTIKTLTDAKDREQEKLRMVGIL